MPPASKAGDSQTRATARCNPEADYHSRHVSFGIQVAQPVLGRALRASNVPIAAAGGMQVGDSGKVTARPAERRW
jgi:hypothetical protein